MDYEEIIKKQLENIIEKKDLDSLSEYAGRLDNGLSDNFRFDNILDAMINGESIFDSKQIISSLKTLFFYEIKDAITIGIEILGICIIIGLLNNLSSSFNKKGVSDISSLICLIVIIGLVMTNFDEAYNLSIDSIKTITYTMDILLPVLIGILISMGQIASGTIMSPLFMATITFFQNIIKNIIMPALFTSVMFALIDSLTEKNYVNKLSKFIRNAALFVTGVIMTLMTGIISVQGLISKTSDSLIVGTAKYSIDEFIPIVGGFTADTLDLFIKCMGSIKNIVGIFGILIIICLMLTPIIKIIAVATIYKLTALLAEPITSKKVSDGLSNVGTGLIYIAAVMFFSSLLFIIFITCIINLGGAG